MKLCCNVAAKLARGCFCGGDIDGEKIVEMVMDGLVSTFTDLGCALQIEKDEEDEGDGDVDSESE